MKPKHFVILGAGIAGLSLAWFLKKRYQNATLTILEKSHRSGGWIETLQHEGFLFEMGPRSCRTKGGFSTLKLIEELGLQDEIIPSSPSAHQRYLYIGNELRALPTHFLSFLFSPVTKGMLPALWHDWRTAAGEDKDESIYDFISRRLHPSIADRFIDPLVSGIYAGDMHQLSLRSCFPLLYEWERKHGSLVKGLLAKKEPLEFPSPFIKQMMKHPMFSFKQGMETLPKCLSRFFHNDIHMCCPGKAIEFKENGVDIIMEDQKKIHADHLFSALSAHHLAPLLEKFSDVSRLLYSISYASVAVISLGYHQKVLNKEGFGYLIPHQENEKILGTVWDSSVFPQQNQQTYDTRLTVMIGGTQMKYFDDLNENALKNIALSSLNHHLKIKQDPNTLCIKIARNAIPQYNVGYEKKIKTIEHKIASLSPHFTLLGNSFRGVSVNDCISRSEQIANFI